MLRRYIILTVTFILIGSSFLQAQRGNRQGARENAPKAILKGKIVDGETKSPLDYATITLFSLRDSSLVTGGISDETGSFELETRPGQFFVKIEFLAYQTHTIGNVQLGKDNLNVDLGVIELLSDSETLQEVEVRAERSQMEMNLDKRVFNVEVV